MRLRMKLHVIHDREKHCNSGNKWTDEYDAEIHIIPTAMRSQRKLKENQQKHQQTQTETKSF